MLNQIILVGRLARDIELEKVGEDKKVCKLTLAVPRSFKNAEGVYETDFIPITLFDNVATNTCEYCHKGDIIGIKGRVQSKNYPREDGSEYQIMEIIAEKVTFLSSRKSEEVDE